MPPRHDPKAVWDSLAPRACDTHTTSYSAIRETFLKLLRPGVDYREAFHKVQAVEGRGPGPNQRLLAGVRPALELGASCTCRFRVGRHVPGSAR